MRPIGQRDLGETSRPLGWSRTCAIYSGIVSSKDNQICNESRTVHSNSVPYATSSGHSYSHPRETPFRHWERLILSTLGDFVDSTGLDRVNLQRSLRMERFLQSWPFLLTYTIGSLPRKKNACCLSAYEELESKLSVNRAY